MGYRTSVIKEAGYIVLEAVISLEKGDQEEIRSRMQELAGMRTSKQPLSYPSAGSTFKRPEGYFAGKLIMDINVVTSFAVAFPVLMPEAVTLWKNWHRFWII